MNLPTHLQERIETESEDFATKEGTKLPARAGVDYRNGYYRGLEEGHLAGASFLYSILKEEKGEVAGVWVSASKRLPEKAGSYCIRNIETGHKRSVWYQPAGKSILRSKHASGWEWLDTETPVVAGCGELVSALGWMQKMGLIDLVYSIEDTVYEYEIANKTAQP